MAEQFKKMLSEWWAQDLPYDSDGLSQIRDNFRAIWDRCEPTIGSTFGKVSGAPFSSPADDEKLANWTSPICFWVRPFFLLPGTQKLRAHFYGMFGPSGSDVVLRFGQRLGSAQLNSPLVEVGKDLVTVTADGSPQLVTLELDWGVTVQRPTFTLLQLWFNSELVGTPTSSGATSISGWEFDNSRIGFRTIRNAGTFFDDDDEDHLRVISFWDDAAGGDNLQGRLDILKAASQSECTPFKDIEGLPPNSTHATLDDISWMAPGAVQIEVVRESAADYFYLPEDWELQPDEFTYSQVMDQFESAAQELAFRPRGVTFDSPTVYYDDNVEPAEVDDKERSFLWVDAGQTTVEGVFPATARSYVPLSMPHEQSQVVNVAFLVGARLRDPFSYWEGVKSVYVDEIDVSFNAEIKKLNNDEYVSLDDPIGQVTTEKIPLTRYDGGVFTRTGALDKQTPTVLLDSEDLALVGSDQRFTLVFLTLRGVPEHPPYSGSDQTKPYALWLQCTVAGAQDLASEDLEIIALPYIWTEGYLARRPDGSDSGDEEIAKVCNKDSELWLDVYDYKASSDDLSRSWGINLNAAGVSFADLGTYDYDRVKVIAGGPEDGQPPPMTPTYEDGFDVFNSSSADPDNMPHMLALPDEDGWVVGEDEDGGITNLDETGAQDWSGSTTTVGEDLYERFARTTNGNEGILALGKASTQISIIDTSDGSNRLLLTLLGTGRAITGSKEDAFGAVTYDDSDSNPTLAVFKTDASYVSIVEDAITEAGGKATIVVTGKQGSVIAVDASVDAVVEAGGKATITVTGKQGSVVATSDPFIAEIDGHNPIHWWRQQAYIASTEDFEDFGTGDVDLEEAWGPKPFASPGGPTFEDSGLGIGNSVRATRSDTFDTHVNGYAWSNTGPGWDLDSDFTCIVFWAASLTDGLAADTWAPIRTYPDTDEKFNLFVSMDSSGVVTYKVEYEEDSSGSQSVTWTVEDDYVDVGAGDAGVFRCVAITWDRDGGGGGGGTPLITIHDFEAVAGGHEHRTHEWDPGADPEPLVSGTTISTQLSLSNATSAYEGDWVETAHPMIIGSLLSDSDIKTIAELGIAWEEQTAQAAPNLIDVTETTPGSGTSHDIDMPATVNEGELLLMVLAYEDDDTIITGPSGWNEVMLDDAGLGFYTIGAWSKMAEGTEGGTTVSVSTSEAENIHAQVARIEDWYGVSDTSNAVAGVDSLSTNAGMTSSHNHPQLSPSWAGELVPWLASTVTFNPDDTIAVSSYATGYGDGNETVDSGNLAGAWKDVEGADEDPSGFSWDTSGPSVGTTLGVRAAKSVPVGVPSSEWIESLAPEVWLDASDLSTLFTDTSGTTAVTSDDDPVRYWADRSGNGRDFRGNSGCTNVYKETGFNTSYPCVRTVADDDLMYQLSSWAQGTPCTIFTVHHLRSTSGTRYLVQYHTNRIYFAADAATGTGPGFYDGSSHKAFGSSTITAEDAFAVVFGEDDNARLYQQDTLFGSWTGYSDFSATEEQRLFGSSIDVDLCEYLFFDGELGTEERKAVISYLTDKWGL